MVKHSSQHNLLHKLQVYLLGAMLLAVPLYPKFPFIQVPGTYVSIRLEDLLIAILGLVWGISILPKIKEFFVDPISRSIILFISIGFVSLISAIFLTKSVDPIIGTLHWARRIEYFLPFFVASGIIRREPEKFYFYLKLFLVIVLLAFVYGYGQKNFNWPIIITQNMEYSKGVALRWIEGSHINATFAGHYDLATYMVLVMPVLLTSIILSKKRVDKVVFGVTFLAAFWLLLNAISRISIVSYMVSVSLALIYVRKYKYIPVIILVSILLFSTDPGLRTRYGRIIDVVKDRTSSSLTVPIARAETIRRGSIGEPTPTSIPVVEDRSSSIRFKVEWPRAIRALSKNPLVGTGYSSITLATDNDYFRMLGEVGVLGFVAFSLIFVQIFTLVFSAFPLIKTFTGLKLAYVAGVFAAIPGLFLNAVFIDIFEASKFAILFWSMMGILVGLISHKRILQK